MLTKCDLTILLDEPGGPYRVGEAIAGVVEITPLDGIDETVLTLTLQWKTQGLGDSAAGEPQTLTLYQGALPPGRLHRYRFTFKAPAGPPTYHGEHLHVAWHLTAHADIPWAPDTTARHEVRLDGTAATPLATLFPESPTGDTLAVLLDAEPHTFEAAVPAQQQLAPFRQRGDALMRLGKKVFSFFGGLMVVMGLAATINDPDVGLPLTLFGAVFWGFSRFVFRAFERFEAARTPPPNADATASPRLVRRGETVHLTVRLPEGTLVTEATASLQGEEHVSYERRNVENKVTIESRRHTFHEQTEALAHTRHAEGPALEATFRVPADAPCSFHARRNALAWQLAFTVEIEDRAQPWHGTVALVVRP